MQPSLGSSGLWLMIAGNSGELDGFARYLVGHCFVNNSQAGKTQEREVINLSTESKHSRGSVKHWFEPGS